jgi:hypothetical protein
MGDIISISNSLGGGFNLRYSPFWLSRRINLTSTSMVDAKKEVYNLLIARLNQVNVAVLRNFNEAINPLFKDDQVTLRLVLLENDGRSEFVFVISDNVYAQHFDLEKGIVNIARLSKSDLFKCNVAMLKYFYEIEDNISRFIKAPLCYKKEFYGTTAYFYKYEDGTLVCIHLLDGNERCYKIAPYVLGNHYELNGSDLQECDELSFDNSDFMSSIKINGAASYFSRITNLSIIRYSDIPEHYIIGNPSP